MAIRFILTWTVAIVVAVYLARQVRKPHRWIGRPFLWLMNASHSTLTDWGLQHVSIEKNFSILDVGCGGGRTIQKLAAIATDGHVSGVDYASGSVAVSRSKNAELIKSGRVDIREASVSQLPFPDASFDLATAVETQYYWPDLVNDMKEVRRVLKPGGRLIVIAETYKGGRLDQFKGPAMRLLKSTQLSADDQRELFLSAGYDDVRIIEEKKRGWICATGRKAANHPATKPPV
jgi:ubiquinone/menaquinone biosynthesis C-methylase UbiE